MELSLKDRMHCDKKHADIPVSCCIARQKPKRTGNGNTPNDPGCMDCEQGRDIMTKYGQLKPKPDKPETVSSPPVPPDPVKMKYCPGPLCQKERPIEDFGNNSGRPDGKQRVCKKCQTHYQKKSKAKKTAPAPAPKAKKSKPTPGKVLKPGMVIEYPTDPPIMKDPRNNTQRMIKAECEEIKYILLEKNLSYGDSAIDPVRIFSKADPIEQINVRIDDKLSRLIRGHEYPGDNDEMDIIRYLVLKRVARKIHAARAES